MGINHPGTPRSTEAISSVKNSFYHTFKVMSPSKR